MSRPEPLGVAFHQRGDASCEGLQIGSRGGPLAHVHECWRGPDLGSVSTTRPSRRWEMFEAAQGRSWCAVRVTVEIRLAGEG